MFFFTNFSKKTTFDGIALKMLPLERAKKMDHFKKKIRPETSIPGRDMIDLRLWNM